MLKKWLHKVLPKKHVKSLPEKEIIPLEQHGIRADMLSFAAEKIAKRLHEAGFQAYVVGGAVRDLLLGVEPKDFDIATDATPEQIRKIFRRSRIIGRRFQIVHVMIGPETIEVTTFRGGDKVQQNAQGRIMKDNTYGSIEEDAMRRDFTCNALYYDPIKEEIWDFHQGVADVADKKLVMIGNPAERYQEDPVRILRAVRLSGKLGFEVEEQTALPIAEYAGRLKNEPVARLFDEILKILFSGYSRACLKRLNELGIPEGIHPLLDALKTAEAAENRMIMLALKNTDERLRADKSVSVGFVLAAVLWPTLNAIWQRNQSHGQKPVPALMDAMNTMRDTVEKGWGVPQRFSATMREIWQFQPQFDNMRGARPYRLLSQARFRAAYDFLILRSEVGEVDKEMASWWTTFQHADEETRQQMTAANEHKRQKQSGSTDGKPKRRRRRPKKKTTEAE